MSDGTLTFTQIMKAQQKLQKSMGYPGAPLFTANNRDFNGTKEMLLAAIVECTEALGEISWKCWKPEGYKKFDRDLFATELTDIIQFVFNAAMYAGITEDELDLALRQKWLVNEVRTNKGETTRE